jgi:hypothetical protein
MGALNLVLKAVQDPAMAKRLLGGLAPMIEMMGGQIQQTGRRAAQKAGLVDELTAFPSVVSQRGMNQGLLGTLDVPTKIPGQAPKPAWEGAPEFPAGSRPTGFLPQSYQGPRPRGGELAPRMEAPQAPRPSVRFTEDLITPSMPAPAATRVAEELGDKLPLRQRAGAEALTEYTTSKGAIRQPGTKLGGQPYSGAPFATERNLETIASGGARAVDIEAPVNVGEQGRNLFLGKGLPDMFTGEYRIDPELLRQLPPETLERFVRMGRQQTPEMSRGIRAAFGADAGPAPVDVVADRAFAIAQELRNAASGARTFDLSGLMDPRVMAALGGLTAAGGLGAGLALRDRGEEGSAAVGSVPTTAEAPDLGIPPVTSEAPAAQQARVLFRGEDRAPLGAIGSSPSAVPSSPNTIATTGDSRGATIAALSQADPAAALLDRMVAPLSPEKYSSPAEYFAAREAYDSSPAKYFAAREAYAKQPAVREALAQYAASTGSDAQMQANLGKWAEANPALAYELQRRALANPAASQQSVESMTTSAVGSSLGSDNQANAIGNAEAVGRAAVAPTQGNFDLAAATAPQEWPHLQRTQDMVRQAAQKIGMYRGY